MMDEGVIIKVVIYWFLLEGWKGTPGSVASYILLFPLH